MDQRINLELNVKEGFPDGTVVKNPPANTGDSRCWFDPWVRKIPWRRKEQPALVFLPGKFHGQRSLVGYSPWGDRVRNIQEQLIRILPRVKRVYVSKLWML